MPRLPGPKSLPYAGEHIAKHKEVPRRMRGRGCKAVVIRGDLLDSTFRDTRESGVSAHSQYDPIALRRQVL